MGGLLAVAGALVLAGVSCSDAGSGSYAPSAEELVGSRHPALGASAPRSPSSGTASRGANPHGGEAGGLPAGHPPIAGGTGAPPPGAGGSGGAESFAAGEPFEVAGLEFTPLTSWLREPPASRFRSAQFRIAPAEGDKHDGELTISLASGDLEANIERWRGQFQDQPEPKVQTATSKGVRITYVDMIGTYLYSLAPMAGGGGEARPGYRVLVAIVEAPRGQIFFKLFGPEKTVNAAEPGLRTMIESFHQH